jgi:rhodanese-related sulfurtransferase
MTMPPTTPPAIPSISAREAADEVAAGQALIVDVRERNEFEQERAAGVVLMPISEFVARHEELPKDRPLLMLCAAGSRSSSATMYLLQAGWTDVRNVTGGMSGWRQAGLPVRSGPAEPGEGALPG